MTLGDRIAVMKDGVVQQIDQPMTIYERPANKFVAGFIGEPRMNFIRGTIVRKDGQLRFLENDGHDQPALGGLAFAFDGARAESLQDRINQPVWFGVRPEQLKIANDGEPALGSVKVEFAEHLGAESWVHLRAREHTLVLRCNPADAARLNGECRIGMIDGGGRFFDGKTEAACGQ
jgi:multiple sugar transport system ATP-binding protein